MSEHLLHPMVWARPGSAIEIEPELEMRDGDCWAWTFLRNHRLTFQVQPTIRKRISKDNTDELHEQISRTFRRTKLIISGFFTSVTVPPPSYAPNLLVSPMVNVNGPRRRKWVFLCWLFRSKQRTWHSNFIFLTIDLFHAFDTLKCNVRSFFEPVSGLHRHEHNTDVILDRVKQAENVDILLPITLD